jgi:hypothetical protein
MKPPVGSVGHQANRILRYRVLSNGDVRGTPSFHSALDDLPLWVRLRHDLSRVIGVYENHAGFPRDGLLFLEDRIVILDASGAAAADELIYAEIADLVPFAKEPVALSLSVISRDGKSHLLPVYGRPGDVSSLAQFVGAARRASLRKESRED